jgi:glycopeptide antibiotics resistance protein
MPPASRCRHGTTPPVDIRHGTTPPVDIRHGTTPPVDIRHGTTPPVDIRHGTTLHRRSADMSPRSSASGTTAFMRHEILGFPNRRRLTWLCLIYAVLMLYSSTLIGPGGMNFVSLNPAEAFQKLLAIGYITHGSDQRADWIGNLLMLVPFGLLVAGSLWPQRPALRLPAALGALLICVGTILTIKYLQLFFPPRTVTLNYVLAQTLGAVIGCAGYAIWHERVGHWVSRSDHVRVLVLGLRLYAGALFLFVLMPLNFALDAPDLRIQFNRLPATLLALPGEDRPLAIRAVLIVVAAAAFIPVGMLLTLVRQGVYRVRRGLLPVGCLGLLLTTGLYGLTTLVISAYPVAPAILYRTAGIVAGAAAIRWLARQDAEALRVRLTWLVPWAVVPYLAGVLLVNRLLSVHWLTWSEAVAQAYPLGFLPLFDYYIVTKAEAAKNIVGHVALYMPVGVLVWLRCGAGSRWRAFVVAAVMSFVVEAGRYLRPGLEGDINAVLVAGLAAAAAFGLMPSVWSMVEALGRHSTPPPPRRWGAGGVPTASHRTPHSTGEVEHY